MNAVNSIEVPKAVHAALKKASRLTEVNFDYLLQTAARESSFKETAKSKNSSASGLFQFIESTWIKNIKENGSKYGLEKYAKQITTDESGNFKFSNANARSEILALRNDPEISALMAAEYAEQNQKYLENKLKRKPKPGELYIAHFLGPKNAARLIRLLELQPAAKAETFFQEAAKKNEAVFYKNGQSRTIAELYKNLVYGYNDSLKVISSKKALPIQNGWHTTVSREKQKVEPLIQKADFTINKDTKVGTGSIGVWGQITDDKSEQTASTKENKVLRAKALNLYKPK